MPSGKRQTIYIRLSPEAEKRWNQTENKSKLVNDALENYFLYEKVLQELAEIKEILLKGGIPLSKDDQEAPKTFNQKTDKGGDNFTEEQLEEIKATLLWFQFNDGEEVEE